MSSNDSPPDPKARAARPFAPSLAGVIGAGAAMLFGAASAVVAATSGGAALGELWFRLSPGGLNVAQAVIQRYLWPPLWDPGLQWVLVKPAWAVFASAAAVSLIAALIWGRRR